MYNDVNGKNPKCIKPGVPIFVEHWGIICNFTPILPYFQHWGRWTLTTIFFQVSKLSEDQKKGLHQKWKTFSPNSNEDQRTAPNIIQRSDADQSQITGEMQILSIVKLFWGDAVKLLGGYIPPSSAGFGTSVLNKPGSFSTNRWGTGTYIWRILKRGILPQ